jgi:hypothetical protein
LSWTQKERRRWKPKSHSHKDADIIKMWKETRNSAHRMRKIIPSEWKSKYFLTSQLFGVTSRKRGWTCKLGRLYVCAPIDFLAQKHPSDK